MSEPSEEHPLYKVEQQGETHHLFAVTVDEGWRSTIVCSGMYRWAAEWLVTQLQGKPYAPGVRP
jgi:hypothetical protein